MNQTIQLSTILNTVDPSRGVPMRVLKVEHGQKLPDGHIGTRLLLANYHWKGWVVQYDPDWFDDTEQVSPKEGQCIQAELVQQDHTNNTYSLFAWKELALQDVGVASLPCSWAKRPGDLIRLHAHVETVQTPQIKALLNQVLGDPQIARKYLCLPASRRHHHAYPGGLLRHSLEVADLLVGQWSGIPAVELDLLVAAGLLHDIGKVRTYRPDGRLTEVGLVVHHDDLTLEVLAPVLAELPEKLAIGLRHLLIRSAKSTDYPESEHRKALRFADRTSAEMDDKRQAFEGLPSYRLRGDDHNGQSHYRQQW